MKRRLSFLFIVFFMAGMSLNAFAEETSVESTTSTENTASTENTEEFDMTQTMEESNTLGAYFGYTNVGGQSFLGFRLQPQLQLGKLGIGLDIPLQVNTSTWKFRTDEYKDGVAYLRLIRFLSWGLKKQDPFYIKVGDLTGGYLGYGMLINNYSNSISVDKRKMGAELDYCYKDFLGIEVMYSDFNVKSFNLLGIRPYVKPLAFTGIPIIKTFDVGVQWVTDHDNTGNMVAGDDNSNHNQLLGSKGMNGFALDMGVTLINTNMARLVAFGSVAMLEKNHSAELAGKLQDTIANSTTSDRYAAAAKNYQNGYGISAGLDFKFKILGNVLRMDTRIERLWYTDYFIPHFFDLTYEMNKDARILSLVGAEHKKGIYGDLGVSVLDMVKVSGGVMLPDQVDETNPAMLRLTLDASKLTDLILLKGEYIKGGLTTFDDALKLDERSLLYVRAAYKVAGPLYVGVDYNWTWAANTNGKFEPVSYWAPYVGLKLDLDFLN
jgi:hypothetical protein